MSTAKPKRNLRERVLAAAQSCLKQEKTVGILDIYVRLGFLRAKQLEHWKKGLEQYPILEELVQAGDKKKQDVTRYFLDWAKGEALEPFHVAYEKRGRHGSTPLRLTKHQNAKVESQYCTKFRRANLTDAQKKRIEQKANKPPELLVYIHHDAKAVCNECGESLVDQMLFLENDQALCLDCGDLAHLTFLPSGDATLTRRSKKHSTLSAVVLEFNKRRKRYDRRGLLVSSKAIAIAEESLEADSDKRAKQRANSAVRRAELDAKLVAEMASLIQQQYPSCPATEANEIATHTAERGSGRVGRSASGRALDEDAIKLAVRAWIRHQHTDYDTLLMQGVERREARKRIAETVNRKQAEWRTAR